MKKNRKLRCVKGAYTGIHKNTETRKPASEPAIYKTRGTTVPEPLSAIYDRDAGRLYPSSDYQRKFAT